jgi:DNA repair protein RecN (Recombination protein N)
MLRKLTINNYVIIDHLEIDFSDSLNMITGETGAGKSILLGALSLILGQRADSKVLHTAGKKCVVEAVFQVKQHHLQSFFEANELDYDDNTIVRREISESGKSRAFVNDTPVNLQVLKDLGEQLINVHSQHETLSLNNPAFQTELIDGVAGHETTLQEFALVYKEYKSEVVKLEKVKQEYTVFGGDAEYLTFQLNELKDANLNDGEQEALEQELKTLEHSEEIKSNLSKALHLLQQSDEAITTQLITVSELLEQLKKFQPEVGELAKRVESVHIELKDIADSIEQIADNTTLNSERIEEVQERLNIIYRLHKKHKTISLKDLLAIQYSLEDKLYLIEKHDVEVQKIENAIQQLKNKLLAKGKNIHENRTKVAPDIVKKVKEGLQYVGMLNTEFAIDIQLQEFEKITTSGLDKIKFLFSANKGVSPDELRKIASGGELSRLMLVLKSLTAENTSLPTLIFDEIDTGISGEVADKVGKQMEQLAKHHQVIAITHLPQIASKGNCHFFVYKDDSGNKTLSRIKKLSSTERVEEIAKMLVGERVTDNALKSARELLSV